MEIEAKTFDIEIDTPDIPQKKITFMQERLEDTREKMEIEARIFIEATKQFTLEWIRREIEMSLCFLDNEFPPENSKFDIKKFRELELESDLKELAIRIPEIVEVNLNNDGYWLHRSSLPGVGFSQDYLEFKKEKMRRELSSSIRMILGCASEIIRNVKEGDEKEPENKIWVKERGRRKYACFLRFSDEMTTSLNRYFEKLEELLILNHEMKEEVKVNNKDMTTVDRKKI